MEDSDDEFDGLLSGSDDDGCIFIDTGRGRGPADPFDAPTAGSSDEAGEFGDDEYETHMRSTLEALLEQADANLYGEAGGGGSSAAECRQWSRSFCHLRARGRAAQPAAPEPSPEEAVTSSSAVADHCVLPVACSAVELQLEVVGRRCRPSAAPASLEPDDEPPPYLEEVLAAHGTVEETLAAHVTGGPDAAPAARREWSRARRFGMPPREPALALVDGVLTRLVDACWRSLQPLMAGVPLLIAHVLARLSAPAGASAASSSAAAQQAPRRAAGGPQQQLAPAVAAGGEQPPALWVAGGMGGARHTPAPRPASREVARPCLGSAARARIGSAGAASHVGSAAARGIEVVAGRLQAESAPAGRCGRAVATPPGGRPRPRMPITRVAAPGARAPVGGRYGEGPAFMVPSVAAAGSRASSAAARARGGPVVHAPPQPAPRAAPAAGLRGETKRLSTAAAERHRGRRAGSLKAACPSTVNDGLRLPAILCRGYS